MGRIVPAYVIIAFLSLLAGIGINSVIRGFPSAPSDTWVSFAFLAALYVTFHLHALVAAWVLAMIIKPRARAIAYAVLSILLLITCSAFFRLPITDGIHFMVISSASLCAISAYYLWDVLSRGGEREPG